MCKNTTKNYELLNCAMLYHCARRLSSIWQQGEPKFKYLTFINVMKMPLNKHGENKTGKPQCKHTHTPTNTHTDTHT